MISINKAKDWKLSILIVLALNMTFSTFAVGVTVTEVPANRTDAITDDDVVQSGQRFWREVGLRYLEGIDEHPFSSITKEMLGGRDYTEITWAVESNPTTIYWVLPISWQGVSEIPLLNLLREFPNREGAHQIQAIDLLSAFNIEVIVPQKHEFVFPTNPTLVVELSTKERKILLEIPMQQEMNKHTYTISDPYEMMITFFREVEVFRSVNSTQGLIYPEFSLREFRGFVFNEDTVQHFRFTGIPVAYNVKFGSTSVYHGFQWAGQPNKLPLRYAQEPLLSP